MISTMSRCFLVCMVLGLGSQHCGSLFCNAEGKFTRTPVRTTLFGDVQGVLHNLPFLNKQVERYLGIPYAHPPVGQLRFEKPIPPVPWQGVKEVISVPKACPQIGWELNYVKMHSPEFTHSDMDEDCLYLNIYVPPTVSPGNRLPVLVHVHGGSNEVGMGAMLHGDVWAALGGIIVITFNYRLGAFGFLSGEDEALPGNYGLYDMKLVLQWVAGNIQFFGGDSAKVTVQGHSAGGADVGQLVLSPLCKGLFRYAIMQSGSPLAYWALLHPPASTLVSTRSYVQNLGCPSTESWTKVKACLKGLDWKYINNANYVYTNGLFNFTPVVDGTFIVAAPERTLQEMSLNGESFLISVTRDEGSLTAEAILNSAEEKKRQFRFEEDNPPPPSVQAFSMIPGISHLVFHEYKPWDDPDNTTANLIGVSHVVGDSTFVAPAIKLAKMMSHQVESLYVFSFNHISRLSRYQLWMGVPHGVDLFYLFGCPLSGHHLHNYSDEDINVSRTHIELWSNFVKHGRLFLTSQPDLVLPTFEETNQSFITIDSSDSGVIIQTGQRMRSRQVAFWNILLPKLRIGDAQTENSLGAPLTWVFVALTSVLLVVVVILALCVVYHKCYY